MKKVIQFPDQAKIQEEAAQWLARLDRGDLDDSDRRNLKAWLAASPANQKALNRMIGLWGEIDCLGLLGQDFPLHTGKPRRRWRRTFVLAGMAAAAIMLLAVGLLVKGIHPFQGKISSPAVAPDLVFRTELGEQSKVTLKDGSILNLNTDSEASVFYSEGERRVYLSRGEAHFEVASNADRPFVVYAGGGRVRALGTAFNVKLADEKIEVFVDEGVVEVSANAKKSGDFESSMGLPSDRSDPGSAAPTSVVLERGHAATYAEQIIRAEKVPEQRIDQRTAWRRGKWIFQGETLTEVLDEVSRYSDVDFVIGDPKLAEMRVGGYFDIGDIDGLMEVLESGLGIRLVDNGQTLRLMPGDGLRSDG